MNLPLTVISGYLGAGKTTLINALLTGTHGKRLMIMVNDFGAVNIDAALLASSSDDTIELTNGCVCCTMGADLFMAVGDVLDRPERPDHLIIEASGIADPARIAEVARTEPDLTYAGIVTVVDALNFESLMQDSQIAPQIAGQVQVADLLYISKGDCPDAVIRELSVAPIVGTPTELGALIWDLDGKVPDRATGHAHFTKWAWTGGVSMDRTALEARLAARPPGLYRFKGFVLPEWEIQVVGQKSDIRAASDLTETQVVGIGPQGQVTEADIERWWRADGAIDTKGVA